MGVSREPSRTLIEACRCKNFWGLSASRNGNSLDKPQDDFVSRYEKFRHDCPDFHKSGHAAYCHRCDNSYPSQIGGVDFTRNQGVVTTNPFEKFAEPLEPRKGPKLSPPLSENYFPLTHQRVPLALQDPGAKIEEPPELSVQEDETMADTEATRALFRELLGMTNGGTAGGRGSMLVPNDIMDSLSGDAAQDTMARNSLIMEMAKVEERAHDPNFIALDLLEMEADNVDDFLASARKKIIKRSKSTRKGCCMKIGGVLDQIMGPAGGEFLDPVQPDDRGAHDPIGDANAPTTYRKVAESEEALFNFIAEEFFPSEHDQTCHFAAVKSGNGMLGESRTQKDYGLLRDRYGLRPGQQLPLDIVARDYSRFAESKHIVGPDRRLFERIRLFKNAFTSTAIQQESIDMDPSHTANALSGFMEASGSVDCYKSANAGHGKGSPDGSMMSRNQVGQLSATTRDDNSEYDTELMPMKGGGKKTAGQPQSLSTRGKDRGDPIGEGDDAQSDYKDVERRSRSASRTDSQHIHDPEAVGRSVRTKRDRKRREEAGYPLPRGRAAGSARTIQKQDVDYDGPQISETANALSNFMESAATLAALGGTSYADTPKTREDERTHLGGPLEKVGGAGGVRKQAARKGQAGAGPRWEEGNDPLGDAGPGARKAF